MRTSRRPPTARPGACRQRGARRRRRGPLHHRQRRRWTTPRPRWPARPTASSPASPPSTTAPGACASRRPATRPTCGSTSTAWSSPAKGVSTLVVTPGPRQGGSSTAAAGAGRRRGAPGQRTGAGARGGRPGRRYVQRQRGRAGPGQRPRLAGATDSLWWRPARWRWPPAPARRLRSLSTTLAGGGDYTAGLRHRGGAGGGAGRDDNTRPTGAPNRRCGWCARWPT